MAMSNFLFPDHTHLIFYALSHVPDNFQGVAEKVLDSLAKLSRVNFFTDRK